MQAARERRLHLFLQVACRKVAARQSETVALRQSVAVICRYINADTRLSPQTPDIRRGTIYHQRWNAYKRSLNVMRIEAAHVKKSVVEAWDVVGGGRDGQITGVGRIGGSK